jgi:hypothetical protein
MESQPGIAANGENRPKSDIRSNAMKVLDAAEEGVHLIW